MSKKIQKVKFNGQPNQRFNMGIKTFPSGVWIIVSPAELKTLIEAGAKKLCDFDPAINEVVTEKKSKKKSRKKPKSKGGK